MIICDSLSSRGDNGQFNNLPKVIICNHLSAPGDDLPPPQPPTRLPAHLPTSQVGQEHQHADHPSFSGCWPSDRGSYQVQFASVFQTHNLFLLAIAGLCEWNSSWNSHWGLRLVQLWHQPPFERRWEGSRTSGHCWRSHRVSGSITSWHFCNVMHNVQ